MVLGRESTAQQQGRAPRRKSSGAEKEWECSDQTREEEKQQSPTRRVRRACCRRMWSIGVCFLEGGGAGSGAVRARGEEPEQEEPEEAGAHSAGKTRRGSDLTHLTAVMSQLKGAKHFWWCSQACVWLA